MDVDSNIDFGLLFEQSPEVLLVLLPDPPVYTMVAATDSRLRATALTRVQTIGYGLFEVFPDNPADPDASGSRNLRASLDRVVATHAADTMAVQQYDIRLPDGSFEVRYWSPRNIPVLSPQGELLYIFHRVEDVTELVKAGAAGEEWKGRTRAMEREVVARSRELSAVVAELREANLRLAELDVAKTDFFSNVSHEFRTPLTLLIGPAEDALSDAVEALGPRQKARLELIQANALRLMKLVGTLLDFSRLEAGRLKARFSPMDLAQRTSELAAMFESAAERAGLHFVIECPPLSAPVWVDGEMWEKIVPNLLSNAFKFTQRGEVRVRLSEDSGQVLLEVSDTGVGVPERELSRIFDRFHRVAGVEGRTHEGTGIGLSLVRELVALHGGEVSVESRPGQGSTFFVRLPQGFAHLPPESVSMEPSPVEPPRHARAHALEATRWSPAASAGETPGRTSTTARARVLVVDDNADLRQYLVSLLEADYVVETAVDGQAALEAVARRLPDIVVSDVMMPRLDGLELVRSLRADPSSASLPVILLSARAGEESSIEGLDTGCDDYLVKPFSARELLARVRTHLDLARLRREWITELERTNRELDAFSYSVSHDLRAPLRTIEGFSALLAREYSSGLDATACSYIDHIRQGVQRMTTLVAALLELAHLSRRETHVESVDLSALALDVVASLREEEPSRRVTVHIAKDLAAHGDRDLLEVVLVNLLGNAWKYTSKSPDPRIEFGRREGDRPAFFVKDNGAGFDMSRAADLFRPFHRLHAAHEFEGNGVGLATVQRAIERQGGKVWAEGEPGRGATLFFELPSPPRRGSSGA